MWTCGLTHISTYDIYVYRERLRGLLFVRASMCSGWNDGIKFKSVGGFDSLSSVKSQNIWSALPNHWRWLRTTRTGTLYIHEKFPNSPLSSKYIIYLFMWTEIKNKLLKNMELFAALIVNSRIHNFHLIFLKIFMSFIAIKKKKKKYWILV